MMYLYKYALKLEYLKIKNECNIGNNHTYSRQQIDISVQLGLRVSSTKIK